MGDKLKKKKNPSIYFLYTSWLKFKKKNLVTVRIPKTNVDKEKRISFIY